MVDSLFSESWYRVADLKPRLRSHVQIHRHTYRGRDWYVIQDHASGRFHRFSQEGYHVIGLMDGRRTLAEIWHAACTHLGDDMPTQEEVIQLLSQLHRADLLQTDIPPDIADLHKRFTREKRTRLLGQLISPFAIRIPLFDPERFLSATQFLIRPLCGWTGLLLWCSAVASAIVLAGMHWEELTLNLADRVLAMENLILLWLAYPVVKTLHELAHAYAVRHWGGEVHEMGIMLLVFVPVPYVDASSSSAFWEKYKRVMVGAAGIITEVFIASLAMLVWVNAEPGAVRSLAFNVAVIGSVSTLLFNGNPLLRFDAYYMLSDLVEIPNLGLRANQYLGYLFQRYLLGMEEVHSPASGPGEAPWLGLYAVASFLYRIFIMVRIALFVAGKFFIVGVVLAGWGLLSMLVMPSYRVLHHALTRPAMYDKRGRILAIAGVSAALVVLMALALPVPSLTVAEGVIFAQENSQVFAGANGFVSRVIASPGAEVETGDPLVACENPELVAEVRVLEAQLREFEARHRLSLTRDRTEAEILSDEIGRIKAELDQKRAEVRDLLIRSPADGRFLLPNAEDMPGRFLRRGTAVGYVVDFSKVTARVVVPQADVDRVRKETSAVLVMLVEQMGKEYVGSIGREVPAASNELPSLALSLEGGGSLALDPRERQEMKAFEKLFHFEILLSGPDPNTIGQRVFVRFEHEPEPLAFRWYRSIRRTLLGKFSV
ncbi:MAG: HlyD family efflux transporter periplasmic adaptor subunit [Thermodesulfobacteriota bacterium]